MISPEQPRIEIDDLAAVIRESIAEQKHHDGPQSISGSSTAAETGDSSPAPELKLQPDFQPRSNNRYHISDLLRYHDRAFVENSYRAILKRPPDATELARDLRRVRSGEFNKIDLLASLRYSNEGKAKGVEIDGLNTPAMVRRLGHVPVIGYFVRLAIALVRLPNQIRDQREFAGYVLSQNQQMTDFINSISVRAEEMSTWIASLQQQQHTLIGKLDAHRSETLEIEPRIAERINSETKLIHNQIEELHNQTELLHSLIEKLQRGPEFHRDSVYAALEDRFRGSRDDIKERLRVYLPYVERVRDGLVIDLGSGRGEWLDLLKEVGISAHGVEQNEVALARCRERGLEVIDDNVLTYLRNLDDGSAGAITGFHIIEHFSIDALVTLLDEVLRVLRPGGVAIFETPNPENVLVGSNFFYLDPTHKHPLPSELMEFLFDERGFDNTEVLKLHAFDSGRVAGEGELAERFNGLFYGPMDYAILGWKKE